MFLAHLAGASKIQAAPSSCATAMTGSWTNCNSAIVANGRSLQMVRVPPLPSAVPIPPVTIRTIGAQACSAAAHRAPGTSLLSLRHGGVHSYLLIPSGASRPPAQILAPPGGSQALTTLPGQAAITQL